MASFFIPPLNDPFVDGDGVPLAGGKLYAYAAGTTTPKATYSDYELTPNTHPIILDADGRAVVRIDTGYYKFILTDANDVVQWTVDKVGHPTNTSNGIPSGGSVNQVLRKVDGTDYNTEWATPTAGRSGVVDLVSGQNYIDVTFSSDIGGANYAVIPSIQCSDTDPIFLIGYVKTSTKASTGFRFQLNAAPDSSNYKLNYIAMINA